MADAAAGDRRTAHDSVTVGLWTAVSRVSGVVRVILVGAVLGPTFFGNTYQITNSVPNLIYYGFLGGSLFASLLVPAMVRHIDHRSVAATARVSGGFLGVVSVGLVIVAPLVVVGLPELLRLSALGTSELQSDRHIEIARLLTALTVPQVFLYAVVGSSSAVMYAHGRFALAAAAPTLENLGIIVVLGLVAWLYGPGSTEVDSVPTGEVLLLGIGSTVAVAVHALVQWLGARRVGITVRPRAGWRDPEVRQMIRRGLNSLAQAALLATQVLVLLLTASRVPGGTVALQIALNFYYLPIALVATPVALAMLPRLSRLHQSGKETEFAGAFIGGLSLVIFLVMPAAIGYFTLAGPVAGSIAAGQMGSESSVRLIATGLSALAIGLIGQAIFFVSTQAALSRGDTSTPLVSMALQCLLCLGLCALALTADRDHLVMFVGLAYSTATLAGAAHLLWRTAAHFPAGRRSLAPSLLRTGIGVVAMVPLVELTQHIVESGVSGRLGSVLALVAASLVGLVTFVVVEALLRSPQLALLATAVRHRRLGSLAGGSVPS